MESKQNVKGNFFSLKSWLTDAETKREQGKDESP